jgi:hypothetical protein
MTCIASLIEEGSSIWMGADSASCNEGELKIRLHPKIFSRNENGTEWLFGCTDISRLSQIVQFEVPLPKKRAPKGRALCSYLVKEFVPLLGKTFETAGFLKRKEGVEHIYEAEILLGLNGHLFLIDENFFVLERPENFVAIGSGRCEAWGVLYATPQLTPKERLLMALKAAEATTVGVRGPFHFIKSK